MNRRKRREQRSTTQNFYVSVTSASSCSNYSLRNACLSICALTLLLLSGCSKQQPSSPTPETSQIDLPQVEWVDESEPNNGDSFSDETASSPSLVNNESPSVQTIYRPDDQRLKLDDEKLKQLGIYKYESQRLILYTDIDPTIAQPLPQIIDQAYEALVAYFGEPPPARSGEKLQFTGYLIGDRELVAAAGLLPEDLRQFDHGQHRGQEFWMYDQEFDYYRRHLMIHEVTHCFMMLMPGIRPPLWYLEGMAELFATHRQRDDGSFAFAVMPEESRNYRGFGRIEMIQQESATGRLLDIDAASRLDANAFAVSRSVPYAWSWALCKFLDAHPRYQQRFRQLGQYLVGPQFQFLADSLFAEDKILLAAEWDQFAKRCEYGWDFDSNAFISAPPQGVEVPAGTQFEVAANQGWQSTGYLVQAGKEYTFTATGEVILDHNPKPWVSEPQGASIEYKSGKPIGRLLVGLLVDPNQTVGPLKEIFEVHDCGRSQTITFRNSGVLMFLVNDFGSRRKDNEGSYSVGVLKEEE